MMKPIFLLLGLLTSLMAITPSIPPPTTIKGCITDEAGEPLMGANVLVQGTHLGTVTDMNGCFELSVPETISPIKLQVSYTGYTTQTILVTQPNEPLDIQLASGIALDEVVIVGAKRVVRRYLTQSVETPAYTRARGYAEEAAPPSMYADELAVKSPPAAAARDARGGASPDLAAGQLTAGEVSDFSKWDMWADISQEDLARHRSHWQFFPDHRYTAQLTNPQNQPLVNALVYLLDGQGNTLWAARTDHGGRAELWAHCFQETDEPADGLQVVARYQGGKVTTTAKPFREGVNFLQLPVACQDHPLVDIGFVVDATGSMGDEISYLQAELGNVIERVRDTLTAADLRLGSVFYRDHEDAYLTRTQSLAADAARSITFINGQSADGGGDTPEAVEVALQTALDSLAWRDEATTRLLFLVLDAPPHRTDEVVTQLQGLTRQAAARGIQVIPVACSGIDKSTEYLMRSLALATNGTYTFLTNHSGIGNPHIEPSTDSYEVEFLNDLLVRLIVRFSSLVPCELPVAEVTPADTAFVQPAVPDTDSQESAWRYYPNPTAGPLTLQFGQSGGQLFLVDAGGKILERYEAPAAGRLDLVLSNYPAGMYWLKHQDTAGRWSRGRVLLVRR